VSAALAALAPVLRCPVCHAGLRLADRALRCPNGHAFDVARQGHVTLAPRRGRLPDGDTAAMVAAREAFLGAGHFAPLTAAIADAARETELLRTAPAGAREAEHLPAPLVVDAGAGPGQHLAGVLDALGDAWGLALDASRPALRRAARVHPRVAAVACDVWRELPLRDAAAHLVLDVFAPRNGAEFARVLAPGGAVVVVTPTPRHLAELTGPLGLLAVDPRKPERLRAELTPHLRPAGRRELTFALALAPGEVRGLVAMGPSAHHLAPDELDRRVAGLPDVVHANASVLVETFRAP